MINTDVSSVTYNTAEGQAIYSIPFPFNEDLESGTPELSVTLDGVELQYNGTGENGYTITPDGLQLAGTVAANKVLVIKRKIRFVQDYFFQVGLIDAKQIEAAFDDSVMRDQQLAQELVDYKNVTDSALEDISEQLVEHQDSIDTLTQNVSDLETNKADKSSVYTKEETDDKLALKADKADTYTKSDVDTKLTAKADKETVYTKTETDSKLATKADASTVYTKTDVDDKLATKADKATTLAGYGITDAYTKEEVDEKIQSSSSDEYVKKSGDTMSGKLSFGDNVAMGAYGDRIGLFFEGSDTPSFTANKDNIVPAKTDSQWLGSRALRFSVIYTKYLGTASGHPIVIPDIQGTMLVASGGTSGQVLTKTESGQEWKDVDSGASLPDQTGNAGKFLTTDGTNASWGEVQPAAITTDATLTGTGAADSPLGIAQTVKDSIDGKVSKSGDTMTGTLNLATATGTKAFTIGDYRMGLNGAQLDLYYKTTPVFSYNPASGFLAGSLRRYAGTSPATLGSNEYQWTNVYTEKLNNGADIAIPTTGGTMALVSDIPDISTLATKTEVQQEIQDAVGTIETALAEV